jgi:hypothetical protein
MMQILRTDWKGLGKWRKIAQGLNAIARLLNDMYGENGIDVEYRGGRLVISASDIRGGGAGVDYSKWAFGFALSTDAGETEEDPPVTICTITPGTIRCHGAGSWGLDPESLFPFTVILDPLDEPWVYAQMPRGGGTVTINVSSTEPVSNASTLKIPLYLFKLTGGSYALHPTKGGIRHIGDVNIDTPLL